MDAPSGLVAGDMVVHIANNRTKTEWEWATEIVDKLIHVSAQSHPVIRDQAIAFREQMRTIIAHNVAAVVRERRERDALLAAHHPEIAAAIRED